MQTTLDGIRKKLDRLAKSPLDFWLWHPGGTSLQAYRCAETIDENELKRAEDRYEIQLPEEYRRFLMSIGNGGAGPAIGLERFGVVDSISQIPSGSSNGPIVQIIRPNATVGTRDLIDQKGNPIDPFEMNFYSSIRDCAPDGQCGPTAPARAFPLSQPFHSTGELGEWDLVDPFAGVWCVVNGGCGIKVNLVLNGPFSRQIWVYEPCDFGGYTPFCERANFNYFDSLEDVHDTDAGRVFNFLTWYDHWLDHTLAFVDAQTRLT